MQDTPDTHTDGDDDANRDSAFEDEGEAPLATPDGGDLDRHTGEKGVLPLGYQGLGSGTTAAEEERGDTLDERLERELPDVGPGGVRQETLDLQVADVSDAGRPDVEASELGIEAEGPADLDGDVLDAEDTLSAEEAAMHIVTDEREAGFGMGETDGYE